MAVASLTWFNLDADYDVWALYFFGAYGLGALAWWAGLRARHSGYALVLYLGTVSAGLGSLALEFRERIALAVGVSTVLASFGSRVPPGDPALVAAIANQTAAPSSLT